MGCDIHLYVEKKVNGKWIAADTWQKDEEGDLHVPYEKRFYTGRNYDLFAILADVRNGKGFAGCDTGDGFNVIDDPRGIPHDACPEYKEEARRWGDDGHSHSFFTTRELMDFDWTQETALRGKIPMDTYKEWASYGKKYQESPDFYCGDISGHNVRKFSMEGADKLIKEFFDAAKNMSFEEKTEAFKKKFKSVYVEGQWTLPYYKAAGHFIGSVMPRLWALGGYDDVRIVFFFDN